MCGATPEQEELQDEQIQFYKQGTQQAATTFAQSQALAKTLSDVYTPILQRGPNQRGFSEEERNNLNAESVEGTARSYAGASRALNEQLAAQGGGNIPLPTGGQTQLRGQLASSSAQEQSSEKNQIMQADYASGRSEFDEATGALESEQGLLNPVGFEDAATGAGGAASKTANDVANANSKWYTAALGAAGAIGGDLTYAPGKGFGLG